MGPLPRTEIRKALFSGSPWVSGSRGIRVSTDTLKDARTDTEKQPHQSSPTCPGGSDCQFTKTREESDKSRASLDHLGRVELPEAL